MNDATAEQLQNQDASNVPSRVEDRVREIEQAERDRQEVALASLPASRREMLSILKSDGFSEADALAEKLEMTASGVRQHLAVLERDGLIERTSIRGGPGRPRHRYVLTAAGDALFPRHYGALSTELLDYVAEDDPAMLERLFDRRSHRRLQQARARVEGKDFRETVAEIATILDEDGYLADFREEHDGSFVITEHNCAVLTVALRYQQACSSEIAFLQEAMPDTEVTRVAHRIKGAHVCAYRVVPRA